MSDTEHLPLRYFAYGSNMSPSVMAQRCPGSRPLGTSHVVEHRFLINERGVATIVPDPDAVVHGVLWATDRRHIDALDIVEGLARGNYVLDHIDTVVEPGRVETALVYLACHDTPSPPRDGYLEIVLEGARHFDLPGHYLEELATWFTQQSSASR